MATVTGTGQGQIRSLQLHPGVPQGVRDPRSWTILWYIRSCINRVRSGKLISLILFQVSVWSGGLTSWCYTTGPILDSFLNLILKYLCSVKFLFKKDLIEGRNQDHVFWSTLRLYVFNGKKYLWLQVPQT